MALSWRNLVPALLTLAAACADQTTAAAAEGTDVSSADTSGANLCLGQEDCPIGHVCEAGVCVEWQAPPQDSCLAAGCPDSSVCEPATGRCVAPHPVASEPTAPAAETLAECEDGSVRTCGVSKTGACRWGLEACVGGHWSGSCDGAVYPTTETCNGQDDDCDGEADEGDVGQGRSCATGQSGVCAAGVSSCQDGVLSCDQLTQSTAEVCDNQDNDCDGSKDELGATSCGVGACARTVDNCADGVAQSCVPGTPGSETCNAVDDDCDGETDENLPGSGACNTGLKGVCAEGVNSCNGAGMSCLQTVFASTEVCDGLDNDCDGETDEGFDQDGDRYTTCGGDCDDADPAKNPGRAEVCDQKDNDCDGAIDDGLSAPIAEAGSDLTVAPPTTVFLDGRRSRALVGTTLTYQWTLVSQPAGSTVTISNATSALASFSANGAGDYVFELQVTDATGCRSQKDQVTVHAVPNDDIHVELTWDKDKTDVDLHYIAPGGAFWAPIYNFTGALTGCGKVDSGADCFFANQTPDWGKKYSGLNDWGGPDCQSGNDPSLDVDDVNGMGPENVNQSTPFDGTYKINVHYYCYREPPSGGGKNATYGAVVGPATATLKVWIKGVLQYTAQKTLTNRENWDAAKLVVSGGRVTSVSAGSNAVAKVTYGCAD